MHYKSRLNKVSCDISDRKAGEPIVKHGHRFKPSFITSAITLMLLLLIVWVFLKTPIISAVLWSMSSVNCRFVDDIDDKSLCGKWKIIFPCAYWETENDLEGWQETALVLHDDYTFSVFKPFRYFQERLGPPDFREGCDILTGVWKTKNTILNNSDLRISINIKELLLEVDFNGKHNNKGINATILSKHRTNRKEYYLKFLRMGAQCSDIGIVFERVQ